MGNITLACPLNPEENQVRQQTTEQCSDFCIRHTFRPTIDKRLEAVWILSIHHINQGGVDPSPRFNTVETAHYHTKLQVIIFVFVLDFPAERGDFDPSYSFFNEFCSNLSFWFANIGLPKEELTIQI